jgi:hypothetical protein
MGYSTLSRMDPRGDRGKPGSGCFAGRSGAGAACADDPVVRDEPAAVVAVPDGQEFSGRATVARGWPRGFHAAQRRFR